MLKGDVGHGLGQVVGLQAVPVIQMFSKKHSHLQGKGEDGGHEGREHEEEHGEEEEARVAQDLLGFVPDAQVEQADEEADADVRRDPQVRQDRVPHDAEKRPFEEDAELGEAAGREAVAALHGGGVLFRGPVPEKRVHLGVSPGLSPVVTVAQALPDGSHQTAVLIAVLAGCHFHDKISWVVVGWAIQT